MYVDVLSGNTNEQKVVNHVQKSFNMSCCGFESTQDLDDGKE